MTAANDLYTYEPERIWDALMPSRQHLVSRPIAVSSYLLDVWRGHIGFFASPLALILLAFAALSTSVLGGTLYVDAKATQSVPPYVQWSYAATNIQDAIDAANAGDVILVTNGVYRFGGQTNAGIQGNRIALTKPVAVISVNGPAATFIVGAMDPPFRCAYLGSNSLLSGFTLTNGFTIPDGSGGGSRCESSAIVSNCVMTGNWAYLSGGGGFGGTYVRCVFTNNNAIWGGGAWLATLYSCVLSGNTVGEVGGGAGQCEVYHCTITQNTSGEYGGGVWDCGVYNSIVYNNKGCDECGHSDNYYTWSYRSFDFSCTWPMPSRGTGNIDSDPRFFDLVSGNLRLQTNSPCIDAGRNNYPYSNVDLDGRSRVVNGTVDMGAYEFSPAGHQEFLAWLQRYSLPADGSADASDFDGDGQGNWQEWRAATDPTEPESLFRLYTPETSTSNLVLRWTSATNRTYTLEHATTQGGSHPFLPLATGLKGEPSISTYTITNALHAGSQLYRIAVE